jgi:hypothetical protein
VKAFVLTFRLFLLERDHLSFANIRRVYDKLPVTSDIASRVSAICDEVGRYLSGPSVFDFYGEKPTRRLFFETWLYGEVAHLNVEKRALLSSWGIADDTRPLVEHEFETIMAALLQAVFWIRQENIAAMEQHRAGESRSSRSDV